MSPAERRGLVDRQLRSLSIARQCQLMGVSRSSLYYRPKGTPPGDLSLMQAMDRQYLETPFELVSEVFSRTNVVIKTASNYGRLLVGNTILSSMAPIIRMSL